MRESESFIQTRGLEGVSGTMRDCGATSHLHSDLAFLWPWAPAPSPCAGTSEPGFPRPVQGPMLQHPVLPCSLTSSGGSSSQTRSTNPEEAWLSAAHQRVSRARGHARGYWEALSLLESTPWILKPNQPALEQGSEAASVPTSDRVGGDLPVTSRSGPSPTPHPRVSHPSRGR